MFLHSPPLLQPNYIVQLVVLSCIKVKISIIYTLCVVHLSFDIENEYLHSIFLAFCMLYHAILIITSFSHMYMDHGLCATTTIRGRNSNLIHGKENNPLVYFLACLDYLPFENYKIVFGLEGII